MTTIREHVDKFLATNRLDYTIKSINTSKKHSKLQNIKTSKTSKHVDSYFGHCDTVFGDVRFRWLKVDQLTDSRRKD